jgi:hypothetical protein
VARGRAATAVRHRHGCRQQHVRFVQVLSGPQKPTHPLPGRLLVFTRRSLQVLHAPKVDRDATSRAEANDLLLHDRLAKPWDALVPVRSRLLEFAKELARQLRFHNIAVAIDDLGAEWPLLAGLSDFPFAHIKVDRKFVTGCATDRLKQTVCHRILDLADGYGVGTVAAGVETQAEFLMVREMGFDKAQGFFLGKPATAKKFARAMLGRPVSLAK